MPSHVVLDLSELLELENGGGLKAGTINCRAKQYNDFCEFVKQNSENQDIKSLMTEVEGGKETVIKLLGQFFFTMRVKVEGSLQWPKKGYAEKIRSNIKMSILADFKIDITDKGLFPESDKNWKSFCERLVKEGRAETTHHPEVDPETMEAINDLGIAIMEAIKARGTEEYESKLAKIPLELRNKLNYALQWIAMITLILFECRRGAENMDELLKNDFVVFEDQLKKFKYIKHTKGEQDKNHPQGTNSSIYGCIPFLDFASNFNPGVLFEFYMSLLPDQATKDGCQGGFLFPKPRLPSKKFNPHDPTEFCLYEPNMKG